MRQGENTEFAWENVNVIQSEIAVVVQWLTHVWLFATPWPETSQAPLPSTISRSLPKFMSFESVMLLNHLIPFCPLLLTFNLSQHQGLFQWVGSSHQVAKVLELQHQSFQGIFRVDFLEDWLVCSPCCPRDFQEFSPTPQFKSINSLPLSLLYGPNFTTIDDYWKNHSFDCMELCQ